MSKSIIVAERQEAREKLARIEQKKRAQRLATVNERFEQMSLADQQMLGRITGVIVQADVDVAGLVAEEQRLHEELKRNPTYKKLLAVREQIKWTKTHKKECMLVLNKLTELWKNSGNEQLEEGSSDVYAQIQG